MYVQVAHYRLGTGEVEDLRSRVVEGPVKVMRDLLAVSAALRDRHFWGAIRSAAAS